MPGCTDAKMQQRWYQIGADFQQPLCALNFG